MYSDIYESSRVEVGYRLLNDLFSRLGVHYNLFLLLINAISLIILAYFITKLCQIHIVCLMVYFSDLYFYYNFSGQRQAVAIALTSLAIYFLIKYKRISAMVAILVASAFHTTAICAIALFFIPRSKISIKHLLVLLASSLLIANCIEYIPNMFSSFLLKDYSYYLFLHEKSDALATEYCIGLIRRFIIILLYLTISNKILLDASTRYLFNIYCFGFLIFASTYMFSADIGTRIGSFFTIVEIVLVSRILSSGATVMRRVVVFCIFLFVSVYKVMGINSMEYYKYQSILFPN